MMVVSKTGPNNETLEEARLLDQSLGFWSNSSMPFLVGKPVSLELTEKG